MDSNSSFNVKRELMLEDKRADYRVDGKRERGEEENGEEENGKDEGER